MKNSITQYEWFKAILWSIIAVTVIIGVTGKMAQDEESFKVEQQYKLERM